MLRSSSNINHYNFLKFYILALRSKKKGFCLKLTYDIKYDNFIPNPIHIGNNYLKMKQQHHLSYQIIL